MQYSQELKHRGLQNIFIACTDGLKAFPEAIEAVYPHTQATGVSFIRYATRCVM